MLMRVARREAQTVLSTQGFQGVSFLTRTGLVLGLSRIRMGILLWFVQFPMKSDCWTGRP